MPHQANQPLPAGYVLNGYRIEKPLSSGGFSIVYLARDPLLDAIRIAPRRARHQIHVARHVVPLPRVDNPVNSSRSMADNRLRGVR